VQLLWPKELGFGLELIIGHFNFMEVLELKIEVEE
jgi:hypothetical protein